MVRVIDPSGTSGHEASTFVLDIESAAGSEIVTETLAAQRLVSVTETVYVPATRLLNVPET